MSLVSRLAFVSYVSHKLGIDRETYSGERDSNKYNDLKIRIYYISYTSNAHIERRPSNAG